MKSSTDRIQPVFTYVCIHARAYLHKYMYQRTYVNRFYDKVPFPCMHVRIYIYIYICVSLLTWERHLIKKAIPVRSLLCILMEIFHTAYVCDISIPSVICEFLQNVLYIGFTILATRREKCWAPSASQPWNHRCLFSLSIYTHSSAIGIMSRARPRYISVRIHLHICFHSKWLSCLISHTSVTA